MTVKNKLIYDHIPKTAGTSLTMAMEMLFGEVYRVPLGEQSHQLCLTKIKNQNVIAGHLEFDVHEELHEDCYYSTLLRDPVDRFMSQYYWNIKSAKTLLNNKDLESVVLLNPEVMSSYLLNLNDFLSINYQVLKNSYSNTQAIHFARRKVHEPWLLPEKHMLDAAISSLEEYDLVGTFDFIQPFFNQICVDFEKPFFEIPQANVNVDRKHKTEISPSAIQKLSESNQVDQQLIQWAKQKFKLENKPVTYSFSYKAPQNTAKSPSSKISLKSGIKKILLFAISSINVIIKFTHFKIAVQRIPQGIPVETDQPQVVPGPDFEITELKCISLANGTGVIPMGSDLRIEVHGSTLRPLGEVIVVLSIQNRFGNRMYETNSNLLSQKVSLNQPGDFKMGFSLPHIPLERNLYLVSAKIIPKTAQPLTKSTPAEKTVYMYVINSGKINFRGLVNLEAHLDVEALP